jgi:outer membrane protein assembly factor BamA
VPTLAALLVAAMLVQESPPSADSAPRPRVTALPLVSYSEVTGLQYGATAILTFRRPGLATRNSSFSAYAAATTKNHAKAYLQLDTWSRHNDTHGRARVDYISYPLPFFGIGADTPDSAEEWYSHGVTTLQAFAQRRIVGSLYVHAGARHVRSTAREHEPDGVLAGHIIAGSSGSRTLAMELGLVIDSRDHAGSPRGGSYVRVIPSIAPKTRVSDSDFRRLTIDARQYRTLGSGYVGAIQVQYDGVSDATPFDLMPMIGADTAMRGYPRGRFRDRHAFTAQAELRTPSWRRLGAVVFAGAGTVAPTLSRLTTTTWFPSAGAGLRYFLSPRDRTTLRADLGVGRGSFGLSLGVGEAF